VAIIGYDLWQRRFGGAQDIIGRLITVNREQRTIIGIMPHGFNFPRATEMPLQRASSPRVELPG